MREQEVYDKFFIDEEYELENAPTETYSYQSGWNNALKRASIIIRNEIRPQGKWNYIQAGMAVCPFCGASPHKDYKNFCPKCGARMEEEDESNNNL